MVATAHGVSLTTLLKDPTLVPLVGGKCQMPHSVTIFSANRKQPGLQDVILGDSEARTRKKNGEESKKSIKERSGKKTNDDLGSVKHVF